MAEETKKKTIDIPAMPKRWPPLEHDYPISRRENMLRMFEGKPPMYMTEIFQVSQPAICSVCGDMPYDVFADTTDWFGCEYRQIDPGTMTTPVKGVMNDVTEWREKVVWPDMDALDWTKGTEKIIRDPGLCSSVTLGNGIFERFHILEPFDNAVADLALEPEECAELFDRLSYYKCDIIDHYAEQYPLDYIVYADDWGTETSQFFSLDTMKELLLEPTKRIFDHIHSKGIKAIFHNCGHVEPFLPYMVDYIGADGLDVQALNGYKDVLDAYGDKVFIQIYPDFQILFDPETTEEQAREHAREIVDMYGAQNYSHGGAVIHSAALKEEIYAAFAGEIYDYSLKMYKGLQ